MIYREYLVMRNALVWYVVLLVALIAIGMVSGAIHLSATDTNLLGVGDAAGWLSAIFASVFGVALGNGSRGPARVLWVLPAERWKTALQIIAVDLVGTTAALACTYAVILMSLASIGFHFTVAAMQTISIAGIGMALALSFAAYGWSALAGMLGRRMAYAGVFALPALMIWVSLAQSALAYSSLVRATVLANPFVVFAEGVAMTAWERHHVHLDPVTSSLQWLGTTWETPILLAIAVATCGVAVVLWQRAETIPA